ncbi:lysosomal acid phosphatase-like isoform X1 [Apis laboriosa]|uniref:lysosomal acid phosphatase-like isoform X1 n=2 Tax=Apis laboriosa TaxID=183418 RepID=UPI001CC7F6FF|nr:lysosomal acid phosphatase-like isoform X1 [Apis laboriosa]
MRKRIFKDIYDFLQSTHNRYNRMSEENKQKSCNNSQRNNIGTHIMVSILSIGIGSILFAYVAFASTIHNGTQTSIQQVIFVFRHGDRNPTETYPNDPYRNYKWQGGWGALTKDGMLRMYNIGQWIRTEYGSIIGNTYDSTLSLTQSSYADRCIMSAQVLLAGLYPPTNEEIFVSGLTWRPVPVHSTPRHLDKMIVVKAPCPRLEKALKEAYVNESRRPESPSSKYYQELSNYTGQNISTITDIEFLYNTLEIEERNGLKLPEWTIEYYNQQMREIAARSLAIFTSNTLQQRLRGGPLLKEILERLNAFNNQNTRRAYFYSAHDITLVNLLRTMGFTNEYFKPEYGSTLIFQLHAGSNFTEDMELKLMYLNDTKALIPHYMNIPKCGTPCLLKNLMKLWKNVLPDNWDNECLHS